MVEEKSEVKMKEWSWEEQEGSVGRPVDWEGMSDWKGYAVERLVVSKFVWG